MVKLVSKVIYLDYHNTCVRLCDSEWHALDHICKEERVKRKDLIGKIQGGKHESLGLTPAIRLFTLLYYKNHYDNTPSHYLSKNIEGLITDLS